MSWRFPCLLLAVAAASCGFFAPGTTENTSPESSVEIEPPTFPTFPSTGSSADEDASSSSDPDASASTSSDSTTTLPDLSAFARPDWLGTRALELRTDGFGEVAPTPEELVGRTFWTIDSLAPPATSDFEATVGPVTAQIADRSTWHTECPVTLDELRYLTISHWGFDGQIHTGEMIINASVVDDIVSVFRQLFEAKFPIEQMRVIAIEELFESPTGDSNDTTSFVCRAVVTKTTGWSQHAYGLAVDINPFHNPYEKGDLVLPELASYYLDRTLDEPGMIVAGDVVHQAFAKIGWGWGGTWASLDDYMHFSRSGT